MKEKERERGLCESHWCSLAVSPPFPTYAYTLITHTHTYTHTHFAILWFSQGAEQSSGGSRHCEEKAALR